MKEWSDRNCDKGTVCARKWREGNECEIDRIKYLSGIGRYFYVKSAETGKAKLILQVQWGCANLLLQPLHPPREWVRRIHRHRTLDLLPRPRPRHQR